MTADKLREWTAGVFWFVVACCVLVCVVSFTALVAVGVYRFALDGPLVSTVCTVNTPAGCHTWSVKL